MSDENSAWTCATCNNFVVEGDECDLCDQLRPAVLCPPPPKRSKMVEEQETVPAAVTTPPEYLPKPPITVRVGPSLVVNAIGLGTLPLGVTYNVGGRPSREASLQLLRAAFQAGIDFVDTADCYSKDGADLHYVEQLVAEALSAPEGRGVVVGTKAGMARLNETSGGWRVKKYTPESLRTVIREQKEALGGERPISLWSFHHCDSYEDELFASLCKAVQEAVEEGDILNVGLCNATIAHVEIASKFVTVSAIQNQYSVYCREAEQQQAASKTSKKGMLQYCKEKEITFTAYGTLGGIKARKGDVNVARDFPDLTRIADSKGLSPQAVLLSFYRHKYPDMLLIVGMRSVDRIADCMSANNCRFTPDEFQRIERIFS